MCLRVLESEKERENRTEIDGRMKLKGYYDRMVGFGFVIKVGADLSNPTSSSSAQHSCAVLLPNSITTAQHNTTHPNHPSNSSNTCAISQTRFLLSPSTFLIFIIHFFIFYLKYFYTVILLSGMDSLLKLFKILELVEFCY